jgi:6-phosphogluconolactonase (cycloisomerase 2 family)
MSYGLAAVNNQFLFASDRSQSQLDGFSINPITGALTALQGSPFPTGAFTVPAGLASPPNGSFLYAADIASVDAFTVSSGGLPTAISGSPFPSGSSLFLTADPSGSFLFSVDDDPPGGVIAFAIGSTGALTEVPNSPFTIPGQTVPDSMPYGIVNNGSYVYTTLSLASQVAGFAIAGGTGALSSVPNSPLPAGTNPTGIVIANSFLYALNSGSISGYSINSNSGLLTPIAGSPFAISGLSLAADSFGQYLFVGGPASIQAFTIDAASGMLTPISGSPFAAAGASLLTVVQIPPP